MRTTSTLLMSRKRGLLDLPERLDDELVPVAEGLGGVDEEAEKVGGLERGIDEVHHPAVQGVERLVDAGIVDEDDLAFLRCLDAQDADARRLRLVRDDGDLLAEEGVEEGGFPDVGPAEQGHVSDLDRRLLFLLAAPSASARRAFRPLFRVFSLFFVSIQGFPFYPDFLDPLLVDVQDLEGQSLDVERSRPWPAAGRGCG